MEWGLSRSEILQISNNAMGQNCATWLISRSCLSKMSQSSSFLGIFSQSTDYYRSRRIVLWWFCSGLNKKTWDKGFRRACLSGKFVSMHVRFSLKLKIIRKILLYYFSCKWSIFAILWFLCIVWYVVATSSWIFMPNIEKCGFKYLFWGPMWFLSVYFAWCDAVLEIVQLPLMLLANQNLFQKHARSFIYAINLNETEYLVLFFLTEKIYGKIASEKV